MSDDRRLRTSVAADLGSLAAAFAPAAAPVELPSGTVVGHFVLEEPLGRGGMGAVYRAHDQELDRRVAIKLGLRGADLARARREAMALARLAHPNVVTIYEIGEHDGVPFVAMELCEGGTIRAWARAAPRTWRDVLAVFLDAGRGLGAAHAAGLVHRDVKPDNILLGGDGRTRIADFGLARGVEEPHEGRAIEAEGSSMATDATAGRGTPVAGHAATLTVRGAIIGTPRYMAPEQLDGRRIDARTDQFAFCVALYEILAGVDPFPALAAARAAAIAGARIAPPLRGREVPRTVLAVIERGLAAEPEARFATMDALLAALTRAARPRWRLPAIIAGVVGVGAIGALLGLANARGARTGVVDPSCASLPANLTPGWNPAARAAFVDGNLAAGETARWAAEVIDREVRVLADARVACEDLLQRSDRSGTLARAGGAPCLTRAAAELDRVIALRAQGAAELTAAVGQIVDASACAVSLSSSATNPDRAGPIWDQIARAEALDAEGKSELAVAAAEAARVAAQADGGAIVIARAEFTLSTILHRQAQRAPGWPARTAVTRRPAAPAEAFAGSALTTIPTTVALDPETALAAASTGPELHVFARSATGTLLAARWTRASGTWTAFAPLLANDPPTPQIVAGEVSAIAVDGHVEAFYREPVSGNLMHAVLAPAGWTVRNEGGLVARVGSTVALDAAARLTFVTPDPGLYPWFDQRIWMASTFIDASSPTGWTMLPEHVAFHARPSAVFSRAADRIDIVALDDRGHIAWHTRQGKDFGPTRWLWRPEAMSPEVELTDPIIVATEDDPAGAALVVVVRAGDGELWIAHKRRAATEFAAFEPTGVRSDVPPVAVLRAAARVTVFGRDGTAMFALEVDVRDDGVTLADIVPAPTAMAGPVSATGDDGGAEVVGFSPGGAPRRGSYRRAR